MTVQTGGVVNQANAQGVVLLPSTAITATGNGPSQGGLGWASTITAQLQVTALATDGTDTIDVYVQTTADGTNWLDVIHFTQIAGSGSAVIRVSKAVNALAQAEYATTSALAAANVRPIFGDQWRVRYVVVDGNAASFTFAVTANFQ